MFLNSDFYSRQAFPELAGVLIDAGKSLTPIRGIFENLTVQSLMKQGPKAVSNSHYLNCF